MFSPDSQGFIGSNFKWFIGQVPPNQNQIVKGGNWNTAWGNRVKVRIVGRHPKEGQFLSDDNLPWAIVEKSTSQGYLTGGSTGIIGGEWVRGYYLDSDSTNPQIPVITAVLDVNTEEQGIKASKGGSTQFKKVDRWWYCEPPTFNMIGGTTPKSQAKPSLDAFKNAKPTDFLSSK